MNQKQTVADGVEQDFKISPKPNLFMRQDIEAKLMRLRIERSKNKEVPPKTSSNDTTATAAPLSIVVTNLPASFGMASLGMASLGMKKHFN